jgi:hypothetical protein
MLKQPQTGLLEQSQTGLRKSKIMLEQSAGVEIFSYFLETSLQGIAKNGAALVVVYKMLAAGGRLHNC